MIDIQGHRGCRGLLPENTIPAFLKALELGVHTLEMDAVVSKEHKLIISHEPFMSHEICTGPYGEQISEQEASHHNIYQMSIEEVQSYDCGKKVHPRFPGQSKVKVHKPSLQQVVSEVNKKLLVLGLPSVGYNIELKVRDEWNKKHHPDYKTFADIAIEAINSYGIMSFTTVQCFHVPTLQYIHKVYPEVKLVYLIEGKDNQRENIEELAFIPHVYSPSYNLVTNELKAFCTEKGMLLIPWTVNEIDDMKYMISLGVDGIITDYPNRLIDLLQRGQRVL